MKTRLYFLILALTLFANHPRTALAAVTFSIAPPAVSNTYGGSITLQIGGLTNAETVVIQKFLDLNANGVIDGSDWLVQQFNLTDDKAGMVIGGVTNFNVPGDLNSATGAITAALPFHHRDFMQRITGAYLYELSSPGGYFKPLTNSFVVTSLPFPQEITGNVISDNTSATVSHAVVLLLHPPQPGESGPGRVLGGVVANHAGRYAASLPPGRYVLMAFSSNHVVSYPQSPVLTLTERQTLTENLSLIYAAASISGKVTDASDASIGLPGVWLFAVSTNRLFSVTFTDTDGHFNLPVTVGEWALDTDYAAVGVHGYVGWYDSPYFSACAGATGVPLAYPKANALFYGNVKDDVGNPLPGVEVGCEDENELYYTEGYTDTNGDYVLGALGGLANDPWEAHVHSDSSPTNYVFSYPTDGGTNLSPGFTVRQDFTALRAPHRIRGVLKDDKGNPIAGVGIWANGTINGVFYHVYSVKTDANGAYSLNVSDGGWYVGGFVDLSDTYLSPGDQRVEISGQDAVANFTAVLPTYSIRGWLSDDNGDPIAGIDVFAWAILDEVYRASPRVNTDADGGFSLDVVMGTWNVDVASGLAGLDYLRPLDQQVVIVNRDVRVEFMTLIAPNRITGSLKDKNGNPVAGVGVQAYGYPPDYLLGYYAQYGFTDASGNFSLSVANGTWDVGNLFDLPPNYLSSANQSVEISDNDAAVNFTATLLSDPRPRLSLPSRPSSGQYQFLLSGVAGQNYTVQMSTNLSSCTWTALFTTKNATANAFIVVDPKATNQQRFYRVLVGP